MKIYFLSCQPAELTLNNVFLGITDTFERFAEVELSDKLFARFTPQNALPVGVFLDESLLTSPPKFCDVYILKDGVALYVHHFPPLDHTLVPIAQARHENSLVTVFKQGDIHISLQTPERFVISTLPPSFENCTLSFHGELCFAEGGNMLAIFNKAGERVLLERFLKYTVEENTLNATLPLSDSLKRVADCRWELHENGLTQTQFTLRQTQGKASDELLAYAFFESILVGADYAQFLSDELQPDAEKLVELLGDLEGVTLTDSPYTCGLVRRKAEHVFELVYATIHVNLGKITDVNW